MSENRSEITYGDLLTTVNSMCKSVPIDYKVYIPPCLLEEAKKHYPKVEWVPSFQGDIRWIL